MRRIHFQHIVVLVVCLICAATWSNEIIEVPLVYEAYCDEDNDSGFQPQSSITYETIAESPPEGQWKLPELNGENPVYRLIHVGGKERLLILDQTDKNAFYNRIYFDTNGNRDLTDDAPIDALNVSSPDGQYFRAYFPGIDIDTVIDGVTMQYRFGVVVDYWSDQPVSWGSRILSFFTGSSKAPDSFNIEQLNLRIRTRCIYKAEFEIGGVRHCLLLCDNNINGRFDERGRLDEERLSIESPLWAQGDRQYLFEAGATPDYSDRMTLTDYINLNNTLYKMDINQSGKKLTLTPVTDNLATLDLPAPVQRLCIIDEKTSVAVIKPGKQIKVPAGTYRLLDYLLYKDEPEGARWQLRARGAGDSPKIVAIANESVPFPFGEPYRPQIRIPGWVWQHSGGADRMLPQIRLEFRIKGAANEMVDDLVCHENSEASKIARSYRNPTRPKEPAYRILTLDGEVHVQGSFEYG